MGLHQETVGDATRASGLDLDPVIADLEAAHNVEPHTLVVRHRGAVVGRFGWAPYDPGRPQLVYSLSKSFTGIALGLLVARGLVDLDTRVLDILPEYDSPSLSEGRRQMLVRHLASMSTGDDVDRVEYLRFGPAERIVRNFLAITPEHAPGTVFTYNQLATYLLATIIERLAGARVLEVLRRGLLAPMGLSLGGWQRLGGQDAGFTGLFVSTDTIAQFGQLLLREGLWEGHQLLPAEWVRMATRKHIPTAGRVAEQQVDWQQGYGLQFWMGRHGYRGDGAGGQFCVVVPEADLVVAMTGHTHDMQAVLDILWDRLLPALDVTSAKRESQRLALSVPLPTAMGSVLTEGTPLAFDRVRTLVAGGAPTPEMLMPALPPIDSVHLRDVGDYPDVDLRFPGGQLVAPIGLGRWVVTERPNVPVPVAIAGGLDERANICVDILFLETPHRLSLACSRIAGTVDADWWAPPVNCASIADLGVPIEDWPET